MSSGFWFLSLILIAVTGVFALRLAARRRVARRHPPVELEAMHAALTAHVSLKTFSDVFGALAHAYGLDPRTIRPDDPLKIFFDLDSWALGAGTEKLARWMKGAGVDAADERPETVLDLLLLVDDKKSRAAGF